MSEDIQAAYIYEKAYQRASKKDWGPLTDFQRSELLKQYNRKVADLDVKFRENLSKKKVMDILHK